jgi:hypothetical protein
MGEYAKKVEHNQPQEERRGVMRWIIRLLPWRFGCKHRRCAHPDFGVVFDTGIVSVVGGTFPYERSVCSRCTSCNLTWREHRVGFKRSDGALHWFMVGEIQ